MNHLNVIHAIIETQLWLIPCAQSWSSIAPDTADTRWAIVAGAVRRATAISQHVTPLRLGGCDIPVRSSCLHTQLSLALLVFMLATV